MKKYITKKQWNQLGKEKQGVILDWVEISNKPDYDKSKITNRMWRWNF